MAGFQFFHIDSYSLTGTESKSTSKKTGKTKTVSKKSIRQITDEFDREPGSIPHIENPEPPEILYGCPPGEIEGICQEYAENSKDAQGRKFRKDGLCLLAGVASLPREREGDFKNFCTEVVDYLKNKYGDRLKCVGTHEKDEEHPHIHFYVVPKIGEKLEDIHEGYKASKIAKVNGKLKGEQNQAYKSAMRGLQDEFNNKVGMKMGLTRLGPGRRRLSRSQWVLEQKQAEQVAKQAAFLGNAKAVAQQGYKDGKKLGYERGKQKFVEQNNDVGARLGGVLAGVIGGLHRPTTQAVQQVQKANEEAEKQKKLRGEEVAKAKQEADRRVVASSNREREKKEMIANLETELKELKKSTDLDRKQLIFYEKKYGVSSDPALPKLKT